MKTIYHNGRVYTGAPAPAQAFVVENGRFVYAGSDAGALALRRTGDRTIYRIRVPWKLLSPLEPVAGKVFGMGIVINDRDNGNAQFRLEFGGGIAAGKKPALFRKMVLLPKK